MMILAIMPWRYKFNFFKRFLTGVQRVANWTISSSYLVDNRYNTTSRAIMKMLKDFLLILGTDLATADQVSKALATVIEYDDAYCFRLQDMMSETTQWNLANSPVREFRRLEKIYMNREKSHATQSVGRIFKLAQVALLHPKIRRSWRIAVTNLTPRDFKGLQLDNADRYHILPRADYNFTGRTFEERCEIYKDIHRRSVCCGNTVSTISKSDDKITYECHKCFKETPEAYIFPPYQEIIPNPQP